jgi:hypothetical protein
MSLHALSPPRFVRRTSLGRGEYRRNFRQVDCDAIAAVTSREADAVTPLMSKIYLRLVNAPAQYWEREGVLRFEAESRDEGHVKAWDALCEILCVASATANKALRWMHEQGVVGYFAGKNGAGIRVFLNRATSSIGTRVTGEKILAFPHASSEGPRASRDEAAFNDSYAVSEVLETDLNPRTQKSGAEKPRVVKTAPDPAPTSSKQFSHGVELGDVETIRTPLRVEIPVDEIVSRLRNELEPSLQSAARRAAAQEHERTREWLETRGLPKAARVAQREAYNVLRKYGVIRDAAPSSQTEVGRGWPAKESRPLSDGEVEELAQACVAMLEIKGRPVEVTLSELSAESGGFLLPADASRVRSKIEALLNSS